MPRQKTLAPVRPSAAIEIAYRRRLDALLDEMHRSLVYWLSARYRANEPEIARLAQDDSPAVSLRNAFRRLARRWQARFDDLADDLARYFATQTAQRSTEALRAALKKGGMSVRFRVSRPVNDVIQASVAENVGLIKSIAQQHLTAVEGHVMRSVQAGRDLASLSEALQHQFGVTKRRAALISRDQSNKATAAITRARHLELGIQEAIWVHSGGGKVPRPTHVRAGRDRVRYNVAEGWFDPAEKKYIQPGELINCLVGDSVIYLADGVEKAYRRRYRGHLTTLITETGETLCATLNHPILTPNGWVSIGSLDEGDYLIELSDDRIAIPTIKSYDDQTVPTISDIFDAVLESGSLRFEVSARDQFHGDGVSNGHVDIADSAGHLRFGWEIYCQTGVEKFCLAMPDDSCTRLGSISFPGDSFHLSPDGRMCGVGESRPSIGAESLHSNSVALADLFSGSMGRSGDFLSSFRSEAFQPNSNTLASTVHLPAGREDERLYRFGGLPVSLRERPQSTSSFVLATKKSRVISNLKSFFSGHVYNLQTVNGWYAAGAIIAGNCRCVSRPVLPGFS